MKSINDIAVEVLNGRWGSGDTRKKQLIDAGYNYEAVQKRVTELVNMGVRTRKEAMAAWFDACKTQHEWSYNAKYNWRNWHRAGKTIKASKDWGTCITYPSVVAMRCKLIKEGRYIASSGDSHASQATLDEFWEYSVETVSGINKKYWSYVKYPKKSLNQLIKTGKVVTGDLIGFIEHETMYVGKDSKGNLLFNNAGHAAGIYDNNKAGSNRAVLNQKVNGYGKKTVLGVFSVNTFLVDTVCTGGTVTKTNLYMAGQDVKITVKPKAGMAVKSIKVDGKAVKASTTYTISKIDANHKIEVVCEKSTEKKGYTGNYPNYKLIKTNAQVITDAIKWAKWIAGDNRFHYGYGSHSHRNGCFFCGTQHLKRGHGIKNFEYTYCCNPFVGAAWAHGGGDATAYKMCHSTNSWDFGTGTGSYHKSRLFEKVSLNSLKAGDVLCSDSHVALYIGGGKVVQAGHEDDNKEGSKSWKSSISVGTWKGYKRAYRYKGSVNANRPLSHGEVSARVADLQKFLVWYGIKITVDSIFGGDTLNAVKKFQKEQKLTVDGWVGEKTIKAMKAVRK